MPKDEKGWAWFQDATTPPSAGTHESEREIAVAAARCFRGRDGERVLAYLRAMTLDRALGPGASDTLLRHMEGQRQLVVHITALVQRGRDGG